MMKKENINHYKRINEILNVSREELIEKGVFNGYLDDDSNYYINPYLVKNCDIPEFANAEEKIKEVFDKVVNNLQQYLDEHKEYYTKYFYNAKNEFKFKEPKCLALGNSFQGISGNGLNGKTAEECVLKILDLVKLGKVNFGIIYSMGIFQNRVGSDRVSDMVGDVLLPQLMEYSQRMYKELAITGLQKITIIHKGEKYEFETLLRSDGKTPLVLLPRDILDPLPTSVDFSDLDFAIQLNQECKDYLTSLLAETYTKTKLEKISKDKKFEIALEYELFDNIDLSYNEKMAKRKSLAFNNYDISDYERQKFIEEETKKMFDYDCLKKSNDCYIITIALIKHFKYLVEKTELINMFYKHKIIPSEGDFRYAFLQMVECVKTSSEGVFDYEIKTSASTIDFILNSTSEETCLKLKISNKSLKKEYNENFPNHINKKKKGTRGIFVILNLGNKDLDKFYTEQRDKNLDYEIIEIDCRYR